MKKLYIILTGYFLLFAVGISAQTDDENIKAMMEMANPGPEHIILEEFVGKWNYEWTFSMGSDAKNMTGKGMGENTMILGGRFLEIKGETDWMGSIKTTLQFIGFDRRNQKYFLMGLDEFGTYGIHVTDSDFDKDKKQFTFRGKEYDPMTKTEFKYRVVLTIIDNDHHTQATFASDGTNEFKVMDAKFTRK